MEYVTYDEFKKMDIRIGTIRDIQEIEGADKLLKFLIQFTEELKTEDFEMADGTIVPVRQILSGIREYYPDHSELIGKQVLYIVNLEPRTIRGLESNGMLMAVGDDEPIFLIPESPVEPGSKVR
jgi:methionine--tRNA ligase beta chain